jgi:hypothetical protein
MAVFEHCVWKANDLPASASLESRLFRTRTSKKATWVGVDLSNQCLYVVPYTQFDNDRLKTYAPVFNYDTNQVEFQPLPNQRAEACDPQAEKGMIRPINNGEEEIVHIWDHVGEDGAADVRLMHQVTNSDNEKKEDLVIRLFYRAMGQSVLIALKNRSPMLVNQTIPIRERIVNFAQHPAVNLEGRSGNAYSSVTLSRWADVDMRYQEFLQGKNLQAVPTGEIAQYIQDRLFILRSSDGRVLSALKQRPRIEVKRLKEYDFGPGHGNLDTIMIHISNEFKWEVFPLNMIISFFSGMFNSEAPRIHQLEGLKTTSMEDLLLENPQSIMAEAGLNRVDTFEEFDRAINAGANIEYYIAENRKIARLDVGGSAFRICSCATTLGRGLTLRFLWDKPTKKALDHRLAYVPTVSLEQKT